MRSLTRWAIGGGLGLTAILGVVLAPPTVAYGLPLAAFAWITDDDGTGDDGDGAIGVAQLSAEIAPDGVNAKLTVTMDGAADAVVEQVFIESVFVSGGSFLGSGPLGIVEFTQDGSPGNLPGGNQPFVSFFTATSASADSPAPRKGIGRHPQDDVSPQSGMFSLTLAGGDFDDLLSDLRVGVHVIGYESGGSESFVAAAVPEPHAALVFGVGALVVGAVLRRRAS